MRVLDAVSYIFLAAHLGKLSRFGIKVLDPDRSNYARGLFSGVWLLMLDLFRAGPGP